MYREVVDGGALLSAWSKVLANGGGPGGDGETLARFAADPAARIRRLQRDLAAGAYRPGPLRRLSVPKKSGGVRPLAIPCVIDRVIQTAAAQALSALLEPAFEDSSFGYRPGRSVAQAVARIEALRDQGFVWVVDGDIERFFENVPHRRLMRKLAGHVADPPFLELVAMWLGAAEPDGRGLAQGSPISPVLANLYLDDVDERIEGKGVRLVRFADDFVLLCRKEAAADKALAKIADALAENDLRLNPAKTRVVPFERGFRFLGKLFVRSMVVESGDGAPPGGDGTEPPAPPAPPVPPPPAAAGGLAPRGAFSV